MLLLKMQTYVISLFVCAHVVCGIVFFEDKAIQIRPSDEKVNSSYFGYSILLQKGVEPIVIVGCPKDDHENGGALYACKISADSKGVCSKYTMKTDNVDRFNGNLLGLALDGGAKTGQSFIACAPKRIFIKGKKRKKYYSKGSCFYNGNSSRLGPDEELSPLKTKSEISQYLNMPFYDNAFSQAGIDIDYNAETGRLLMGAPGIMNWNGALISLDKSDKFSKFNLIPNRNHPMERENINYLGYAVTTAKIDQSLYYVAGAPRAENFYGAVRMYRAQNENDFRKFTGLEFGGYFGSSLLCSDVNNNGKDDLFVGAPTSKGDTYDEGYVHFFLDGSKSQGYLYGSRKQGARFGTSMSALGDIDLDEYHDIAISAPYEDDGTGAVYIYMGDKHGIKSTYSQRLSPKKFYGNHFNVKGFGLGLSKGNDIDGNGHNDVAIGAYQSNDVFVFISKNVIDIKMTLNANLTSILDSPMSVEYCIFYRQRSSTNNLKTVDFRLNLQLDHRTVGDTDHVENVTVSAQRTFCRSVDVIIEQQVADILPYQIILTGNVLGDVVLKGETQLNKEIPYSHGCGTDNICQTNLIMNTFVEPENIVLELHNDLKVLVSVTNTGEPGYECDLLVHIPEDLNLDQRGCKLKNNTYTCLFSRKLLSEEKQYELKFDFKSLKTTTEKIEIDLELKCLGENPTPTKQSLGIAVLTENSPYIEGKPEPENIYYDDDTVANDYEISHTFTVGNDGPSPVKLNVYLLLPMVQHGDKEVFEFISAVDDQGGYQVQCYPSNETNTYEKLYDVKSLISAPLNNTIIVDSFDKGSTNLEILCQGGYLKKFSVAKYTVKVKLKTSLLAAHFSSQLQKKSNIAYIASAFLSNSTLKIEGHSVTLIFSSHKKDVPLWVWILAAILGILSLAVLIFLLKKCNFFERHYRDKLNDQRLIEGDTADNLPMNQFDTHSDEEPTK